MYVDFHTHGKLAKYLPFSVEYTRWLLGEAKSAGLDAICLTEHFNTQQFDEVYGYIASHGEQAGDAFVFDGLKVFPGMETDIAEGGHVLSIGPMEAIRRLGLSGTEGVLYVGDSEVDAQTAKNAGLGCVLVTWGFRTRQEMAPYSAFPFIDRPEELLEFV